MNVNKNERNKIQKERRSFLKKAAYAAPKMIVLGALLRPSDSKAFGAPPSLNEKP